MKIIYITSSKNASGGSRQALYLANGMKRNGHDVTFFTPKGSSLCNLPRAHTQNIEWRTLPEKPLQWGQAVLEATTPGTRTIVHAFHNKAVKVMSLFGTLWRLQKKQIFCVAHRGVIYPPRNPLPYLLPGIRMFAVNSTACLNTLPLLWRKDCGCVIFNGIPAEKITPTTSPEAIRKNLSLPDNAFIIGSVGNNTPVKGMDVLIKAFAQLPPSPHRYLVLVGLDAARWLPQCDEAGITQQVRIVARTENVADYLQIYSVFVLPSLLESSPNTLLEAMSMGCAAVASKVGGVPECLPDDRLLFTPGDSDELAQKLAFIENAPGVLQQAAENNLQKSASYALENRIADMEKLYTGLH